MTDHLRRGVLLVSVLLLMAAAIPGITAADESVGPDCVGHEGAIHRGQPVTGHLCQ